jgi:hypothetical protein
MTIAVTLPMMRINDLPNANLKCCLYTIPFDKCNVTGPSGLFELLYPTRGFAMYIAIHTSDSDALDLGNDFNRSEIGWHF